MKGLIHIYCGDGNGKTTAAVGLAVRAAGAGLRVLFLQFMKDGQTGELVSFENIPNITVLCGKDTDKFVWSMDEQEIEKTKKIQCEKLEEAVRCAGEYDMVVFDEALGACCSGFLSDVMLCKFLDEKPEALEVVLTGRNPSKEILERADYISEIKKVKHPYDKGIYARKGIEH
ncbi:MAG: cob(I)yrinic acid a,c-diamide adenosyltransferase [Christensenella sp.]